MITKTQFQSLIKDKLLWPGWNWNLKDTVDGIQNTVNEEIESLVEILIDNLYTTHQNTEAWVDIFNIDKTCHVKLIKLIILCFYLLFILFVNLDLSLF